MAGRKMRCKDCGDVILVNPDAPASKPKRRKAPAESALPSKRSRSRKKKSSRSKKSSSSANRTPLWIGLSVAGVAVLGGAAWFLFGGVGDPETSIAGTEALDDIAQQSPVDSVDTGGATEAPSGSSASPISTTTAADSSAVVKPAPEPEMASVAEPNAPFGVTAPVNSAAASTNSFPLTADPLAAEWSEKRRLPRPESGTTLEYPAAPTPYLAVGFRSNKLDKTECWDLATGKRIGQLSGNAASSSSRRSLSSDGKTVATLSSDLKSVEIWSFETGNQLGVIPVEKGIGTVNDFLLPSSRHLVTASLEKIDGKFQRTLRVFDATNGKLLKAMSPEKTWYLKKLGVSCGGKYLARMEYNEGITVYATESLSNVLKLESPTVQSTPGGCAFSPDGTQLAAVWTNHKETLLRIISLEDGSATETTFAGNLTQSPLTGQSYLGPSVEWLPDNSGWLLFGRTVVEAASKRRVWTIDAEGLNGVKRRQNLPGSLLCYTGGYDMEKRKSHPVVLKPIRWPKEKVQESLKLLDDEASARILPGSSMSVSVEVGDLKHGSADETITDLKEALENRLRDEGMEITDAGAILHAQYSEMDGQKLFQRDRAVPRSAQAPTGPGVQSTVALIKLEIRLSGEAKPVWKHEVVVNPSALIIRGEVNAASARDAMFRAAQFQITAAPIPYLIPKDESLPILPGLTLYESM